MPIHHPISFAQYKLLEGMPNSLLKHIDRSPRHLWHAQQHPMHATPAMVAGSLADHLLFGTEFAYAVSPYDDYRSKEAKQWRDDQQSAGIAVVKQNDMTEVSFMVGNIKRHPAVLEIMQSGRSQVGITHTLDHPSGVPIPVKGLIDWVSDEVACLADLKTTTDASPREFAAHVVNMGYDAQAAYYLDIWKAITGEDLAFVWIVAEVDPPNEVIVYHATPEVIARGREVNAARLNRYAEVVKTGAWVGYPDTLQPLSLPPWAAPKA